MKTKKGYITITLAMAIGISIIGGITTFYKVNGNTDKEMGEIRTDVAVNNSRVNMLEAQFVTINNKLDQLLLNKGISQK